MTNLHKNKLLTWLVLLLVIINIGSMIFIWMGKPKHEKPMQGSPKDFLSRELKFDEKQQVQFNKLVDEHRDQANEVRKKIKEEKEEMYGLLKSSDITDSLKISAVAHVAEATKELDLITLNHFEKVRNICTPEQKKKLDHIMMQMLGMMTAQQPMRPLPPPMDSLRHKKSFSDSIDQAPNHQLNERRAKKSEGHQINEERGFDDGPPPPHHDGPPQGDHRGPPPPGEHRGPPPGDHRRPPPPPRDHKLPPPPDHK
jgi:Spy/CpxP family protein refolding chaperone